jgi:hypothetical protein
LYKKVVNYKSDRGRTEGRKECAESNVAVVAWRMLWLGDRMRRDADKAERNTRRTRDDEGVGDRGEGQETKGKKAWYYKRALVLKEEVLKRKEGASSSSVGGVAVGDIEEWRFDGAQASAKVASLPPLAWAGEAGRPLGRGVACILVVQGCA